MLRAWHGLVVLGVLVFSVFLTPPAFAHERREVGKYTFIVGWLNEPAIVDQINAISVAVTHTETKQPIDGLDKTLQAQVSAGGRTVDVKLRSRFNQPGNYVNDVLPTRAGVYVFRFFGTVEGLPIDERFESGPGRFDDIVEASTVQFPERAPSATDAARQLAALEAGTAQARVLALAGIGIGGVGLLLAAVVAWRRPATRRTVRRPDPGAADLND